jgi:uroporphyrinogen decarboxylase
MNRRDRILTAMNREEPDHVPITLDIVDRASQDEIFNYYGVRDLAGLYRKTGVDCFSVWHTDNVALPVYCGPERAGVQLYDSTTGFWGMVIEHIYPLVDVSLDTYRWPRWDDFDYSHLKADLEDIHQHDFPAVSGHAGVGWLHHVRLRSYNLSPLDVLDDAWMSEYMARNRDFALPYFENLFRAADGAIDVIRADEDLGGQDRMLISPRLWRKWYKPLWKEVFDICHRHGAKVWLHSCGYCRDVVPDFIEMGADVLSPVPPYVRGSDPGDMKACFGRQIAFDGGVDQMNVMIRGTPDQVRDEVKLRIDQLAPGGGYILGTSQAVTRDIPLENLVAMFETAVAYGVY